MNSTALIGHMHQLFIAAPIQIWTTILAKVSNGDSFHISQKRRVKCGTRAVRMHGQAAAALGACSPAAARLPTAWQWQRGRNECCRILLQRQRPPALRPPARAPATARPAPAARRAAAPGPAPGPAPPCCAPCAPGATPPQRCAGRGGGGVTVVGEWAGGGSVCVSGGGGSFGGGGTRRAASQAARGCAAPYLTHPHPTPTHLPTQTHTCTTPPLQPPPHPTPPHHHQQQQKGRRNNNKAGRRRRTCWCAG